MSYKLFVDLDGVLVNFTKGVQKLTGKNFADWPKSEMFAAINKDPNFFRNLEWMENGRELWEKLKQYDPEILTGLPRGKTAAAQKRDWCAEEIGPHVKVHTCWARDKWKKVDRSIKSILIDDLFFFFSEENCKAWSEAGGYSILYDGDNEKTLYLLECELCR